jgi:hypothetical protein
LLPLSEISRQAQAVTKKTPIFLGLTRDKGSTFALAHSNQPAKFWKRAIFDEPTKQFYDDIVAGAEPSRFYEIFWHPEGNKLDANHFIDLPLLVGNFE